MARTRPSLASQAAFLALGSLFTQGAAFLSLILLAHLLPKEGLGGYQQLLLLYAVTSPLFIAGIPAALLYYLPRAEERHERARWVGAAYLVLGGLGALAAVLLVVFSEPLSDALGNPALESALVAYAPYVFFTFVAAVMPNTLIAEGLARRAAALNALGAVMWMIAVLTAAATGDSITRIAVALSISAGVMAVISVVVVLRATGVAFPRLRGRRLPRSLLAYGIPLGLTGVIGTLGFQLDRFVVSANFPPAEFAVYAVGAVEVPLATLIRQSTNSVLVPAMSRSFAAGDLAGLTELWRESMRKLSLIMLPMFVLLMVVADDLIQVLFGSKFSESATIFRIYLLLLPIQIATWGLIPMAVGRPVVNVRASALMLILNGGLALAFVGPFGIYGPAIATPIAVFAVVFYFIWEIHRMVALSVRELLPLRVLWSNLLVSLAAGIPAAAVALSPLPALPRLVFAGLVFGVVWLVLARRTKRITDDDWHRLLGVLPVLRRRVQPSG